jgi:hypothetical protein
MSHDFVTADCEGNWYATVMVWFWPVRYLPQTKLTFNPSAIHVHPRLRPFLPGVMMKLRSVFDRTSTFFTTVKLPTMG